MAALCWRVHMYVNEPPEVPWVYIDHAIQPKRPKYRIFKLKGSNTRLVCFRPYTELHRRGCGKCRSGRDK